LELPLFKFSILIFLLAVSGFFSGAETALFSFGKFGLSKLEQETSSLALKLKYLLKSPARLLLSILLGNECVNVTISSLVASIFIGFYGTNNWKTALLVSVFISTPIILIFSEITPKAIAIKAPKQFSIISIRPLFYFNIFLDPFIKFINKILCYLKINTNANNSSISEEDFLNMVSASTANKNIEEDEKKMIYNIFDFSDTSVDKIMTLKEKVFFIRENTDFKTILEGVRNTEYSRIPVLDNNTNFVVGLLYSKKLLPYLELYKNNILEDFNIKDLIVPVVCITKKTKLYNVFKMLKKIKQHFCVVVDEHGDFIGIVTMEDILEEIFGEIYDERDFDL
jgi:putative hemolysin